MRTRSLSSGQGKVIGEALTFDDVLLVPDHADFVPSEADVRTRLTRKLELNIPLLSSAMDTVTEWRTAVTMAREGGLGIIHKNLSVEHQAREVLRVKRAESGMIVDPVTIGPEASLSEARALMKANDISGLPVVQGAKPVGILTSRDLRFENNFDQPVSAVMTRDLVTVTPGVSGEQARGLLHKHRIEKLLAVSETGDLVGLITVKDLQQAERYPTAIKDGYGRLRCGAAVGVGDDRAARCAALAQAGVDVIVLDTAHGDSRGVLDAVGDIKQRHPEVEVIAGNVAYGDAVRRLVEAGVDAVKVGVGPGSICTTRIVAGVGMPQVSAIMDCAEIAAESQTPVIADGGIKFSGDLVKAIASGANAVMIGSLFAGSDEAPGELVIYQGRTYKSYRGMGSLGAMKAGSKDRYGQAAVQEAAKLVPEGIEGRVPYRGPLSSIIYQLVGGLRSGMGYTGNRSIQDLRERSRFVRQSPQGLREAHVHDVMITVEAPNYHSDS